MTPKTPAQLPTSAHYQRSAATDDNSWSFEWALLLLGVVVIVVGIVAIAVSPTMAVVPYV